MFLRLIGVYEFFFVSFSLAQIFFLYFARPSAPHKFSNGPSLISISLIDLDRKYPKVSEPMGIDKRGVSRGKCTECNECDEYETSGSNILCEYCGRRPVQHEVISQISASGSQVGSVLEPPEKRPKPAEEEEQNNDVSDGENEVTMIDNAECCTNDNTRREDDLVGNNRTLFHGVCTDVFKEIYFTSPICQKYVCFIHVCMYVVIVSHF